MPFRIMRLKDMTDGDVDGPRGRNAGGRIGSWEGRARSRLGCVGVATGDGAFCTSTALGFARRAFRGTICCVGHLRRYTELDSARSGRGSMCKLGP